MTVNTKKNGSVPPLEITPFYEENGKESFSETFLVQVFRRIVLEGTIYKTFYDGSLRTTIDFTQFIKNKEHEVFFVKYEGEDAGFFWLTEFKPKSAFIHYCFHKNMWGKKTLQISKACLEFILNKKNSHGEYAINTLLGLTPANNKLAIKFLMANGMTILGTIPGMLHDVKENQPMDGIFSYKQRSGKSKRLPFFPWNNLSE